MDKAELNQITEINRVKDALTRTESKFLKRDYEKHLLRLRNELAEYRRYKYGTTKN